MENPNITRVDVASQPGYCITNCLICACVRLRESSGTPKQANISLKLLSLVTLYTRTGVSSVGGPGTSDAQFLNSSRCCRRLSLSFWPSTLLRSTCVGQTEPPGRLYLFSSILLQFWWNGLLMDTYGLGRFSDRRPLLVDQRPGGSKNDRDTRAPF